MRLMRKFKTNEGWQALCDKWAKTARTYFDRYLNKRLATEGVFKCPREFILLFFNENDFELLCQNDFAKTRYILTKNS